LVFCQNTSFIGLEKCKMRAVIGLVFCKIATLIIYYAPTIHQPHPNGRLAKITTAFRANEKRAHARPFCG
jgi:hypothetical protein